MDASVSVALQLPGGDDTRSYIDQRPARPYVRAPPRPALFPGRKRKPGAEGREARKAYASRRPSAFVTILLKRKALSLAFSILAVQDRHRKDLPIASQDQMTMSLGLLCPGCLDVGLPPKKNQRCLVQLLREFPLPPALSNPRIIQIVACPPPCHQIFILCPFLLFLLLLLLLLLLSLQK
jgi:hypothetical protein